MSLDVEIRSAGELDASHTISETSTHSVCFIAITEIHREAPPTEIEHTSAILLLALNINY